MTEQQLQAKILKWLENSGFFAIKIITASKAGVPDIVGCTREGKFFAIEVKTAKSVVSKLQEYKLDLVKANCGIAFVARSLDDVIDKLGDK